jgi:hypothetical protein
VVSPIAALPNDMQRELLDDLNDLNTAEIKSFCKRHSIPYAITIETKDGCRKRTMDDDRKGVMLNRMRHFLQTGVILGGNMLPSCSRFFGPASRQANSRGQVVLRAIRQDKPHNARPSEGFDWWTI